jgi:DNA-binding MarR family transcriptional regulator
VTVSDACIAASVPATTALRWFAKMEENGLIVRRQDPHDARRAHVELTEGAAHEVASWLKRTFVDFCRG